jgi:hypothetical protein
MAELIPLPLTEVQKIRLLVRHFDGRLTFTLHVFGISAKYRSDKFTVAFPLHWDFITDNNIVTLVNLIEALIENGTPPRD